MKKVLATLVLILVASTVSAAEVKIGAWGRGFFVPYFSDGDTDAQTLDTVSWGGASPRVGITVSGSSDNVGFQADINNDGGSVVAGDQQKIWVKPIDMLTVSVGRVYDDTLRGNGCFGDFDWLRITGTGEDFTFARVSTHDGSYARGGAGSVIALDPMKELHAFVAFKSLGGANGRGGANEVLTLSDAMKNITAGAGFTIGTLGQIRAQYIGNTVPEHAKIAAVVDNPDTADVDETAAEVAKEDEVNKSAINAAFKFTMIQNLYADLGFFYALADEKGTGADAGYGMKIPVYVKYTMGAIGIHALFQFSTKLADIEDATKDVSGMEAGLGLDYAIGNGLGAVASFRYQDEGAAGVKDGRIGGMVGVEKGFSNGKIGAGVEFATTSFAPGFNPAWAGESGDAAESASIAVPVKVEYWF
jgi:hypothetical protein